jgi:NADH:ubiquinone oxidoreductase subunit 6 (subunit J)
MNASTLGFLLLGIWLIASGAMSLTGAAFPHAATILAAVMLAAGILIILGNHSTGRRWWS